MTQLHCYVPDKLAVRLRQRAASRGLSVSKYLADLVRRDVESTWPEAFFSEVVGGWQGKTLKRPPQEEYEDRIAFAPDRDNAHVSA